LTTIDIRLALRVALPALLAAIASPVMAQSIEGTATYRERVALPQSAMFEAVLEDVSRADAPAVTVARTQIASLRTPPIAFTIAYDQAKIAANRRYAVRARIFVGDKVLFTTDTPTPVLTGGSASTVSLMMRLVGSGPTPPATSSRLAGTSWQLVKFQGSDGTPLTPDDRAKYTIDFDSGGRLAARIDCNRGRGTWKSSGSNQMAFGPLALTRAKCPAGSLHDQIVKQWGNVRSYVIRNGHLFLALMADGGIYEFEPIAKPKP
jgi:uncharacterized lipoprotein YbaY